MGDWWGVGKVGFLDCFISLVNLLQVGCPTCIYRVAQNMCSGQEAKPYRSRDFAD
jgi:hypothetical protein